MYNTAQNGTFSFNVDLQCDLNFSSQIRRMEYPLGQASAKVFYSYHGVFEGNNHTVSGLRIILPHKVASDAGFFYALGSATIRNLRFDSSCVFSGAWAGALAVKTGASSYIRIENIHGEAAVASGGTAGGLIGLINSPHVVLESCSNSGNIFVTKDSSLTLHGVGGIVGGVSSQNFTARDCHNNGFISLTMNTSNRVFSTAHASGIIGTVVSSSRAAIVIDSCTNSGDVTFSIGNLTRPNVYCVTASGITSLYPNAKSNLTVHNCHNTGTISVTSQYQNIDLFASGIAALSAGVVSTDVFLDITDCTNSGDVTASGAPTAALSAGIVSSLFSYNLTMVSCMNRGFVTSTNQSAGLAFVALEIANSVNTGIVNSSCSYGIAKGANVLQSIVSMGDLMWSDASYATVLGCGGASDLYIRDGINAMIKNGLVVYWNSTRWIVKNINKDAVEILNTIVGKQGYSMWWTSNLTLGHRVTITGKNLPPSVTALGSRIVAEHGETLRSAITREDIGQLLDETKYFMEFGTCGGINEQIVRECSVSVKDMHALKFTGVLNQAIYVPDGYVPTSDVLKPINQFINNKAYIIALATNSTVFFDASAPVTSDASYIIKKTATVEVVIGDVSGLPDDDIIEAITDGISDNDPSTIVRVIEIIREDDGSVVVRVSVEEDKADAAVIAISDSNNTILKRVRRAFIVTELSTSSSFSLLSLLPFFLSLLSFI